MKVRRNIYIIIGSILILFNILVDVLTLIEISLDRSNSWVNVEAYTIGYFIGAHTFLIIGLVLLRFAYKLNKKIKNKNNRELHAAINEFGTQQV